MPMHHYVVGLALIPLLVAACDRTPVPPAPRLTLTPDSLVLALHGSARLSATVTGVPAGPFVDYRSSDTSIVLVDTAGAVRSVGYGTTWVSARARDDAALADSVPVRVPAPPGPYLIVLPDSATLYADMGWLQLAWRVGGVPDTGGATTAVRFVSSDTSVLEARPNGLLCARKPGSAVVRGSLVASPAARDSSLIRVVDRGVAYAPPSISIASIVDSAGKPVDLSAVHGTITVNLNLDTPPWRCLPPFALQLLFDAALWRRSPEMGWGTLRAYAFTVDTRSRDAAGQPLLPNGNHTLSIVARDTTGIAYMSTSQSLTVSN